MNTWRIRLRGQVQGVGFRPFVWKAAVEHKLYGWVSNGMAGVEIRINATQKEAEAFMEYLVAHAPQGSAITQHILETAPASFFDNFTIDTSDEAGDPVLLLTPDVALCATCRADLYRPGDRRHGYAFTTCTYCGPRFSVVETLPYDRAHTTMRAFSMCPTCLAEYNNPSDRRFFAQTNTCPTCGVRLKLDKNDGTPLANNDAQALKATVAAWHEGQIVAIKGIGGYLLTCDATNAEAVRRLRQRKNRPSKPFALLYPDIQALQGDVALAPPLLAALQSPVAPIVLCPLKTVPQSGIAVAEIAPGLDRIGAMLPCAPLLDLLANRFGKPLVATSGNASRAPIVFEESALPQLAHIADAYLQHNRAIVVPQDDSVLSFANNQHPIVLRRSRGLAPTLLLPRLKVGEVPMAALGAEMKGTFTLAYRGNLFVSQYLGDLSDFEAQQRYEGMFTRTLRLLNLQPAQLVGDLHPSYYTTHLGETWAASRGIPFIRFQHHEAHFAAVLAENGLLETVEPVLGIIWDGTGYGRDGHIWGGECFRYSIEDGFGRVGHLPYFPTLLGDKMPREPRLSALAVCQRFAPEMLPSLAPKFTAAEWSLYPKLAAAHGTPQTSSMGRLFDAVASFLGLADKVSYEGEAALLLETAARQYLQLNAMPLPYPNSEDCPFTLSWLASLIEAVQAQQDPSYIAARFHLSLIEMVRAAAEQGNFQQIAFSGGVFQNTLLVELLQQYLSPSFKLHFHHQLSPNDESISFGQYILSQHTTI